MSLDDFRARSIRDLIGTWYVAQTRPKHTRSVSHDLEEYGIPTCVPLVERRDKWKRVTLQPLLAGYVFCCIETDEHWYLLRRQPHVYGELIKVVHRTRFVEQLDRLLSDIQHNPQLGLVTAPVAGTPVEVVRGPFMGRRGTIIGRGRGTARVAIYVSEPGFAYELEVDVGDIELISAAG